MMTFLITIITYIVYRLAKFLYSQRQLPFFHPLLLAPAMLIGIISIVHISASEYIGDAKWLSHMLAPATVAFAVPIYKHRQLVLKYISTILASITAGSLIAIFSSYVLAEAINLKYDFVTSILPRSITTPIAIEVSKETGGLPTLTTVFVIMTGVVGGIVGPMVIKWLSIKNPIAKGLALGMGAHGAGTNKAMEYGEQEATFSSIGMIFAAVITFASGILLIPLLMHLGQLFSL
ncbi:LrgB family protein [Mesobacillus zeae]|uniref:LrgB family protein n=1 Tax=Mesobacillus zeae TaxID=1917180 RepID=A0A398AYX0_9BACI|nr:LrgB family protein [Mesobacillus zeae]RID82244.1 LrgB family protein [Mesobacillus zeae]